MFETLGRHNINKKREKPRINWRGIPHFKTAASTWDDTMCYQTILTKFSLLDNNTYHYCLFLKSLLYTPSQAQGPTHEYETKGV